jgi:hypothetical protein
LIELGRQPCLSSSEAFNSADHPNSTDFYFQGVMIWRCRGDRSYMDRLKSFMFICPALMFVVVFNT